MNNYWFTNYAAAQGGDFTFRYVLTSGANLEPAGLSRLGWEEMSPLEVDPITSQDKAINFDRPLNAVRASFLQLDPSQVVLVTWKRAEDGEGTALRLVEVAGKESTAKVQIPLLRCFMREKLIAKVRRRLGEAILAILCCGFFHGMVVVRNLRAQEGTNRGRYEELVQRGEEAESAGDWNQAIATFEEALKLKPTSAFVETKLAGIYLNRKEFEKALDYSGRALTSDSRNVEATKVAGLAAYNLNRYDLAAKYFHQAIALKGNDAELHYWLGMTLYSLRDARHALDEFYRARLYNPKDTEDLYMIGKIHWEMCRQAWEEMVKVNPDSVRVKQMVAEQDELRNLFPEAITKYQEIIKQQPAALGFNYALGKLYLHIARIDEAEQAFHAELKLDPHSAAAYYGLGEVAFERQNLPVALENASQAIKEKPDFGDAYVLLGRVELNMGDKHKAMEVLEHAAAISPSDPSPFYMLGRVYTDLGRRDLAAKAVATYQQLKDEQEKEIRVAR